MLEFTFALLPLLMMTFVLLDVSWAIFTKSAMAYAVRAGLRVGVTTTGAQALGTDLTTMVKTSVQRSANGLLGRLPTDPGWQKIKVHYYQPPDPGSAALIQDMCNDPNGNKPGYIMTVSIEGYTLNPLVARILGLNHGVDASGTVIGAIAADLIEPSRDLPAKGVAP
jgi:hypothetical protein